MRTRAERLRQGWSGEHDGCPLHGHATDQMKASEGCTCERHLSAKKLGARVKALIEKYEEELAAHKSGEMMSMAEAVHGEKWCEIILKDLRKLEED